MDVFLMIRRKKLSIFTDAKDNTSVSELKRIIEGILKVPPESQQLFNKDNVVMDDEKTLQDYGMNSNTAKAQNPATVGLAIRMDNGEFEQLEIAPLSSPPDLPYVMKSQEANGKGKKQWRRAFYPERRPAKEEDGEQSQEMEQEQEQEGREGSEESGSF